MLMHAEPLQVARRGAVLYFVLAELANMDVMYQFSLSWFQRMFATCIANPASDTSSIASSAATAAIAPGTPRPGSAATLHDSSEELEHNGRDMSESHWGTVFLRRCDSFRDVCSA